MKYIEYSYETSAGGGGGTREFDDSPNETPIFKNSGGSKNGAKVYEYDIIQVHIKWDEFEESFELRNNK